MYGSRSQLIGLASDRLRARGCTLHLLQPLCAAELQRHTLSHSHLHRRLSQKQRELIRNEASAEMELRTVKTAIVFHQSSSTRSESDHVDHTRVFSNDAMDLISCIVRANFSCRIIYQVEPQWLSASTHTWLVPESKHNCVCYDNQLNNWLAAQCLNWFPSSVQPR